MTLSSLSGAPSLGGRARSSRTSQPSKDLSIDDLLGLDESDLGTLNDISHSRIDKQPVEVRETEAYHSVASGGPAGGSQTFSSSPPETHTTQRVQNDSDVDVEEFRMVRRTNPKGNTMNILSSLFEEGPVPSRRDVVAMAPKQIYSYEENATSNISDRGLERHTKIDVSSSDHDSWAAPTDRDHISSLNERSRDGSGSMVPKESPGELQTLYSSVRKSESATVISGRRMGRRANDRSNHSADEGNVVTAVSRTLTAPESSARTIENVRATSRPLHSENYHREPLYAQSGMGLQGWINSGDAPSSVHFETTVTHASLTNAPSKDTEDHIPAALNSETPLSSPDVSHVVLHHGLDIIKRRLRSENHDVRSLLHEVMDVKAFLADAIDYAAKVHVSLAIDRQELLTDVKKFKTIKSLAQSLLSDVQGARRSYLALRTDVEERERELEEVKKNFEMEALALAERIALTDTAEKRLARERKELAEERRRLREEKFILARGKEVHRAHTFRTETVVSIDGNSSWDNAAIEFQRKWQLERREASKALQDQARYLSSLAKYTS